MQQNQRFLDKNIGMAGSNHKKEPSRPGSQGQFGQAGGMIRGLQQPRQIEGGPGSAGGRQSPRWLSMHSCCAGSTKGVAKAESSRAKQAAKQLEQDVDAEDRDHEPDHDLQDRDNQIRQELEQKRCQQIPEPEERNGHDDQDANLLPKPE
jgi:hypothetical protein